MDVSGAGVVGAVAADAMGAGVAVAGAGVAVVADEARH